MSVEYGSSDILQLGALQGDARSGGDDDLDEEDECDSDFDAKSGCELCFLFVFCF